MTNREEDDFSLYKRFIAGDERALSLLIERYRLGLLRFLYGYVQDEDTAETLFSDVFLALYFKRAFTPKTSSGLKPYLYKIARNKALNHLKKIKRRREISLENLLEKGEFFNAAPLLSTTAQPQNPQEILENRALKKELGSALKTLQKEYREVLLLRYYDHLSPKEIAKVLRVTEKQVYNRLQRGKAALRKSYLQSQTSHPKGEFYFENDRKS